MRLKRSISAERTYRPAISSMRLCARRSWATGIVPGSRPSWPSSFRRCVASPAITGTSASGKWLTEERPKRLTVQRPHFRLRHRRPNRFFSIANLQDTVNAIHDCFDGDEEAQMVVLGWSEGYRGAELREFVGVDQAGLDYAIKRIRRTMTKRYPDGWKKQ